MDRLPSKLPINGQNAHGGEDLAWPERRRRWEKARIVAESLAPDAVASSVAARYGPYRNQLYAWRREPRERGLLRTGPGPTIAPLCRALRLLPPSPKVNLGPLTHY